MTARYELRDVGVFDRETGKLVRREMHEWQEFDQWELAGNKCDLPPPPPPEPERQFDPILAGRAREARQMAKLAETNPLEAALVAAGIKRRKA